MRTAMEIDRLLAERALKAAEGVTPQHTAASAEVEAEDGEEAEQRRLRVQHLADPFSVPAEMPEVAHVDVGKLYRDALNVPANPDFPAPGPVNPEVFRRGPVAGDHAACSPGYEAPGWSVPVPTAVLAPGMISRPLLTDGQARPSAEGC
jgi:hypothetical protein